MFCVNLSCHMTTFLLQFLPLFTCVSWGISPAQPQILLIMQATAIRHYLLFLLFFYVSAIQNFKICCYLFLLFFSVFFSAIFSILFFSSYKNKYIFLFLKQLFITILFPHFHIVKHLDVVISNILSVPILAMNQQCYWTMKTRRLFIFY